MVCTNCLYGSNNRMTASSTSAWFLRWELCLNEEVPATFDYGQDSTFLFGSDYRIHFPVSKSFAVGLGRTVMD